MIQILIVLLGALLGFVYGMQGNGFIFSSNICLFAGITLIMPSLFQVKMGDVMLIYSERLTFIKSLLLNYLLLPLIALAIGLLIHDYAIAAGLFLLAVLSGGGMVMHWIKKSGANSAVGFILLFINLLLVSLALLQLHLFGLYTQDYFSVLYSQSVNMSNYAWLVIKLLIILPFIASRVVMLFAPLQALIIKFRPAISNISIFIILFYLFGLQTSQNLVDLYEFEPERFAFSLLGVLLFYGATLALSLLVFNQKSASERAAFWHSITRYITLALLIATFSIDTFGAGMILPIMMAYLIQIPLAVILSKQLNKRTNTL